MLMAKRRTVSAGHCNAYTGINNRSEGRLWRVVTEITLRNKKSSLSAAFDIGLLGILFLHDKEFAPTVLRVLLFAAVLATRDLRLALTIALAGYPALGYAF